MIKRERRDGQCVSVNKNNNSFFCSKTFVQFTLIINLNK